MAESESMKGNFPKIEVCVRCGRVVLGGGNLCKDCKKDLAVNENLDKPQEDHYRTERTTTERDAHHPTS